MWLLAGLMTVITLVVGILAYYVATYYAIYDLKAHMPLKAQQELEYLIATGQRGSDRFYELYDVYGGESVRPSDLPLISFIALLSTTVGGGIALLFARRIIRPITAVAQAAARVSAGDRSVRVDRGNSTGEPGELVDSFNKMAEDIEAYERERTVLTAGIAHELRTPLTILKGRLHGLIDGVIRPDDGEAERLLRQVEQLSRLVEDLRTLAYADAGELELDLRIVDPGHLLRAAVSDLRPASAAIGATFDERYEPARVRVDPLRLTQIATNLLTNAIKHSPPGGTIRTTAIVEGHFVRLCVEDEGPGFDPEDTQRLFVPFWRAGANKAAGRPGSGMGLALAAILAEAHGSKVIAENRSDRTGARFSLRLPLHDIDR